MISLQEINYLMKKLFLLFLLSVQFLYSQVTITKPKDNQIIYGNKVVVEGVINTNLEPPKKIFIIIKPVLDNTWYVQGEADVYSNNSKWRSRGILGGKKGNGESFMIKAILTNEDLKINDEIPTSSINELRGSDSIIVTREDPSFFKWLEGTEVWFSLVLIGIVFYSMIRGKDYIQRWSTRNEK